MEENENNLTVMVLDGRFKYYQKTDVDKLLNSQQKEIEQLREHKKSLEPLFEILTENTKLKEQLKEIEEGLKELLQIIALTSTRNYKQFRIKLKQLLTK